MQTITLDELMQKEYVKYQKGKRMPIIHLLRFFAPTEMVFELPEGTELRFRASYNHADSKLHEPDIDTESVSLFPQTSILQIYHRGKPMLDKHLSGCYIPIYPRIIEGKVYKLSIYHKPLPSVIRFRKVFRKV